MKNMNILWVIPIMIAVLFAGCKKDEEQEQAMETDVSFSAIPMNKTMLKADDDCFETKADYAVVWIDDDPNTTNPNDFEEIILDVFYIDDLPFTKAFKKAPGTYYVKGFFLMDDANQNGEWDDGDPLTDALAATPWADEDYAEFIENPLDFPFTVTQFTKEEIPIEVLCYNPAEVIPFGFGYFDIDEVVIRELCFFGDICVKHPQDYAGSYYETKQTNGLQIDMPAIYKLKVFRNGNPEPDTDPATHVYSNDNDANSWGEDAMCIQYADYLEETDNMKIELWIYVKVGTGNTASDFDFVHFHDIIFTDELVVGADGIYDFVLGTCVQEADLFLPPYMNLPETATWEYLDSPGTLFNTYFDVDLTNIPTGYDIWEGEWPGWCINRTVTINPGPHDMYVYSSLYPLMNKTNPEYPFLTDYPWDHINWLMNHLDWYPGYTMEDVQGALWKLEDPSWNGNAYQGIGLTGTGQQMVTDATDNGTGFYPLPGGYAAVIFVDQNTTPNATNPEVQTVFVEVDP